MSGELDQISRAIGKLEGTTQQGFDAVNNKIEDFKKHIEEKFIALPCSAHTTKLGDLESFNQNLKGKITIISTLSVLVGGFLMWLAEEIFKRIMR